MDQCIDFVYYFKRYERATDKKLSASQKGR